MSQDQDISYLERKARQCFRLAEGCANDEVAASLRQIGYEFVGTALELGADPKLMPDEWLHPPPTI
jgi:hypothetical protein